jgi:dephospho-CoA kinase
VVGQSGSGKTTLAQRLSGVVEWELISAVDILKAAAEGRGSAYGELISEYAQKGRDIPTHIVIKLLGQAMKDSGKNKFIINNFPLSLDQVGAITLAFVNHACACPSLLDLPLLLALTFLFHHVRFSQPNTHSVFMRPLSYLTSLNQTLTLFLCVPYLTLPGV